MPDCIFCKIVKSELPSYKIYEDENFYVFLDIQPRTKGHTLIVPKKHYRWVYDVPNFEEYWSVALKITRAMQKSLKPLFVAYVTHGMDVEHAHLHVIPRYKEDTSYVPGMKKFSKEEFQAIAEKIKNSL